jgi:hypothetical protein
LVGDRSHLQLTLSSQGLSTPFTGNPNSGAIAYILPDGPGQFCPNVVLRGSGAGDHAAKIGDLDLPLLD